MDEVHSETATEAAAAGQGVQQVPPAAGMPLPPRSTAQQFWDAYDEDAGWWATHQSIMNTRRAAFLLVLQQPTRGQDETHAETDARGHV
jgi:hypothetical protein